MRFFNLVYNDWFLLTTYVRFFDSSDYYIHMMLDLQMVVVKTRTNLTSYIISKDNNKLWT